MSKWRLKYLPATGDGIIGVFQGPVPRPGDNILYRTNEGLQRQTQVVEVWHLTDDETGRSTPHVCIYSPIALRRFEIAEYRKMQAMAREHGDTKGELEAETAIRNAGMDPTLPDDEFYRQLARWIDP